MHIHKTTSIYKQSANECKNTLQFRLNLQPLATGGCRVFTFVRRTSDTNLRCFTWPWQRGSDLEMRETHFWDNPLGLKYFVGIFQSIASTKRVSLMNLPPSAAVCFPNKKKRCHHWAIDSVLCDACQWLSLLFGSIPEHGRRKDTPRNQHIINSNRETDHQQTSKTTLFIY